MTEQQFPPIGIKGPNGEDMDAVWAEQMDPPCETCGETPCECADWPSPEDDPEE